LSSTIFRALVTFSGGQASEALAAFESALKGANEVSQEAYLTVANERKAREQAAFAKR
jgi:PP-loop superfamily ATP-utilizing enzyme